ncbi:hypothetical protein SB780_42045, partial [Burkholderia sp. SIMBA_057]
NASLRAARDGKFTSHALSEQLAKRQGSISVTETFARARFISISTAKLAAADPYAEKNALRTQIQ